MTSSNQNKKTRIFMTGATGYIGTTISEYAIKEGYEVHGLSRSEAGDEKLKALGVTPVRGDLTTLDVLRHESSQADIVIQLAFMNDFQNFEKVLQADRAAIDAMCEPLVGTGKSFIVTSGTLLNEPDPNHGEVTEDSPMANSPLTGRKISEDLALSYASKDVRANCLRLAPFVYGRGGSGFLPNMIQKAVDNGESIYVGDGSACFTSAYVDDVAQLYLLTAKSAKPGELFNATTTTNVSFKEIAEAIGSLLKLPVRSVTLDEATKLWNPFFANIFSFENRASGQKARQQLGWKPSGIDVLSDVKTGSYVEFAKKIQTGEGGASQGAKAIWERS
ncbi:NAD(P)-binding protein [Mollisia scopiformis]|uniref:NAD(P)-binding protein n=1 Tax=Mollisia scopiformis TaxID=149040 RepID=A0A132BB86_MOLSC|nr:NAD(P)-binding protein [Mollisia scopiformis]KUJ09675.1 NAD(P)-binding protein [Mollisia scopiformis]